jgi:DNA polymerase-3 subunit delta'
VTEGISQQSPSALVDRAIQENRLAHAMLIYGQNLKSVESFANELASKLVDSPLTEEGLAWHPDVFALRPSKKSRIISVDDTRELIRNIQHSPQKADRKIALVHEADRFNPSAANAFLKTLEEPPLNTNILLLTTRPHSLLATIRSRCQLFRLPTGSAEIEDSRALAWLADYHSLLGDMLDKQPSGKAAIPHYVMGIYGLIERFRHIIEAITKETWKEQAKQLPEDLDDDERIAMESRISISLRQEFLSAIEQATEHFTRERLASQPEAASKMVKSIQELEKASRLLRLNLRPETALEAFLLKALRIWSA